MDISTILNRTAPLAIDYCGEKFTVNVFTDRLTPQRGTELTRRVEKDAEESHNFTALILSELLESWDVTKDGEPYPPTYENLQGVPFTLLQHLYDKVSSWLGERNQPQKKKKPRASASGE